MLSDLDVNSNTCPSEDVWWSISISSTASGISWVSFGSLAKMGTAMVECTWHSIAHASRGYSSGL